MCIFKSNNSWDTDVLYRYDEFYAKKPVLISLNWCHGPQKTGPRWFSSVPSIFGLVLDWLRFTVVCFGGKKPDWTKPLNTTCKFNLFSGYLTVVQMLLILLLCYLIVAMYVTVAWAATLLYQVGTISKLWVLQKVIFQHWVIEATVSVIELYKVTIVMLMQVQMVSDQQPQYAKHTNSYPHKQDPSQPPQNHNQYISLSFLLSNTFESRRSPTTQSTPREMVSACTSITRYRLPVPTA